MFPFLYPESVVLLCAVVLEHKTEKLQHLALSED